MKIKPLFDRVVLKRVDTNNSKNSFGLIIPESTQEKPLIGEILEIGEDYNNNGEKIEMRVKKGDKVIFSKYAGVEIKLEQKEYIILRQSDILAIIND